MRDKIVEILMENEELRFQPVQNFPFPKLVKEPFFSSWLFFQRIFH
jgi:hypothetical protein